MAKKYFDHLQLFILVLNLLCIVQSRDRQREEAGLGQLWQYVLRHSVHWGLYNFLYTVVHIPMYNIYRTLYTVKCVLYTVLLKQFPMWTVYSTLYTVYCKV